MPLRFYVHVMMFNFLYESELSHLFLPERRFHVYHKYHKIVSVYVEKLCVVVVVEKSERNNLDILIEKNLSLKNVRMWKNVRRKGRFRNFFVIRKSWS